jgi:hypothetical protein
MTSAHIDTYLPPFGNQVQAELVFHIPDPSEIVASRVAHTASHPSTAPHKLLRRSLT